MPLAEVSPQIPVLLAAIFSISVVLIGGILTFSTPSSGIKILGSSMVLALSFAANSVWTYGIAIFVVATLVTELEFLEKLAALFTNRKEYWEYLSRTASRAEIQNKVESEARKAVRQTADLGSEGIQGFAQDYHIFEGKVFSAIHKKTPPFEHFDTIETNLVIKKRSGRQIIVDAIVRAGSIHYLIEVQSWSPSLAQVNKQFADYIKTYSEYTAERKIDAVVVPVLVVAADAKTASDSKSFVVLRFDANSETFINPQDFKIAVGNLVASLTD